MAEGGGGSLDASVRKAVLLLVGLAALAVAATPVVYDERHITDTLFLASLGWRMFLGFAPVADFPHFYAGVTGSFVAWAFALVGPTVKALDVALLLQAAAALALAGAVAVGRFGGAVFWPLAAAVAACVLARAPFETQTALIEVSSARSFLYNRFAIALGLSVALFALIPARGRAAEAFGAVAAGAALTVIALTKPIFAAFAPAVLAALLVQGRWASAAVTAGAAAAALMALDPWAETFLGAFAYLGEAVQSREVGLADAVGKAVRLVMAHPEATLAAAAGFGLAAAGWRVLAAAALALGGGVAMGVTMGEITHVGQQAVPFLAVLPLAAWELARREGAGSAPWIKGVALVLVGAFALPTLANTIAVSARAMTRGDLVQIETGPMAGYLGWHRGFRLEGEPVRGRVPLERLAEAVAERQRADGDLGIGDAYVMLADGIAALRGIEGAETAGIVGDFGLHFDFALGAPPVLGWPVWAAVTSPEIARGDPLPAEADLVLVLRETGGLGSGGRKVSEHLRARVADDFELCRTSTLWDIFVRRSSEVPGCGE